MISITARPAMSALSRMCSSVIQYETPKVVTVHNPTIGLLRRALQIGVVLYVCLYQLWYAQVARGGPMSSVINTTVQGYQEFAGMESSVTTKVNMIPVIPVIHVLTSGEGLLTILPWSGPSSCPSPPPPSV